MLRLLCFTGVGFLLLSGCVSAPPPPALSLTEKDAICEMVSDVKWQPFGNVSWEEDPQRTAELDAVADENDFFQLPERILCEGKRIELNESDGIPFDSFWLSQDGTQAAISGGWFGGELLGGGGICYFSKPETKWLRRGCVATWSI